MPLRQRKTKPNWPPPSATAEVLQVRKGMFGVKGTGDTSGYGGLTRVVEFPPPTAIPPFGGWWDQVYERIGALIPNYSDVITKVVIHRGEITFHVAASTSPRWSSYLQRRRPPAVRVLQQRLGRALSGRSGP